MARADSQNLDPQNGPDAAGDIELGTRSAQVSPSIRFLLFCLLPVPESHPSANVASSKGQSIN